jgi:hypothetical protein
MNRCHLLAQWLLLLLPEHESRGRVVTWHDQEGLRTLLSVACRPGPYAQDLRDQPHGSRSVLGTKELWLCHVPRGTEHATHQKRAPVSPCAPWQGMPPTRKGLRCHHVPRGTARATRQEWAPVLPRAPRHRARHPAGEGSGVGTFLAAPGLPPAQEGSGVTT